MGKTAFLFSGQGAQRAGMGKEFYEHFASVRALFDAAEELRPGTLQQMFAGSDDELRQTENTQPCLYLADLAAAGKQFLTIEHNTGQMVDDVRLAVRKHADSTFFGWMPGDLPASDDYTGPILEELQRIAGSGGRTK